MSRKIRVAVVGVGNCAKSLIEGVALYSHTKNTNGLAFPEIGGYKPCDIEFVLAYDVDVRKVGEYLCDAIYAKPNCAIDLLRPGDRSWLIDCCCNTVVRMGKIEDGVAVHMIGHRDRNATFAVSGRLECTAEEVRRQLIDHEVDVLVNYLPVGSELATRFYLSAALKAGVPFVNCIPVFTVSTPEWDRDLKAAGIPAIGDDMRSQLGASVLSQARQELLFARGMHVKFHEQVNHGGNTDFLNMMDQTRLASKKISKENVIRSQNDIRGIPVPKNGIFAGPSTYIPYHGDNKIAHFRIEAEGFGGAQMTFDGRLSVQDSPNSAGVVIDAIRYLKVAHEMGMVGALHGPSAFTQKSPPEQVAFQDAYKECEALANRRWTRSTRFHNTELLGALVVEKELA